MYHEREEAQRAEVLEVHERVEKLDDRRTGAARLVDEGTEPVLAVDVGPPQPAQMVQAERVQPDPSRLDADDAGDGLGGVGGDVAEPHRAYGRVGQQRLGDDAGRVGEVEDPRVGRYAFDHPRDVDDDGYGAQRADEPAGAGRLVAHEAELHRKRLIPLAGGQSADPDLGDDELGTRNGPLEVARGG